MEDDLAFEIEEYLKHNIITDITDLLEIESIDENMIKTWDSYIDDMRVDINKVNIDTLKK